MIFKGVFKMLEIFGEGSVNVLNIYIFLLVKYQILKGNSQLWIVPVKLYHFRGCTVIYVSEPVLINYPRFY